MKRAYSRGEKALFLAPLLMAIVGGGVWKWRESGPVSFQLPVAGGMTSMEFSPDGKRLLVFFGSSTSYPTIGRIYDLEAKSEICELQAPTSMPKSPVFSWPSWSPDGKRIVSGYNDGTEGTVKKPGAFFTGSFSIDKSIIGRATHLNQKGKIAVWNTESGSVDGDYFYASPTEDIRKHRVRFSADGKTLVGDGRQAAIFDAKTGRRQLFSTGGFAEVSLTTMNESLGLLAALNAQETSFQVYDVKAKRVVWKPSVGSVFRFHWCGDVLGVIHSSRDEDSSLLLWNGKTRKLMASPPMPKSVYDFSFSNDKKTLRFLIPSASETKQVVCWDYRQGRELSRVTLGAPVDWPNWSPDGQWILSMSETGEDATVRLQVFDQSGKVHIDRFVSRYDSAPDYDSYWSPDSKRLAAISDGKIVILPVGE